MTVELCAHDHVWRGDCQDCHEPVGWSDLTTCSRRQARVAALLSRLRYQRGLVAER